MRLHCVDLLHMPLLPLFLVLSLLLHIAAGFFLLGRDMALDAAAQPARTTDQPAVVQVMLAPVSVPQPETVKPITPASQPLRRQEPLPPRPSTKEPPVAVTPKAKPVAATVPAPAAKSAAAAAAPVAAPAPSTPHVPDSAKAHAVAEQSAPTEVFSRHPAFRLPPQQPRYPAQARRRNQEGVVLLEVRLDARGAQREIKLIRSSGFPSLDKSALEAVAGWRFHPETVNGKGVPSRVQIPIEFALLASR